MDHSPEYKRGYEDGLKNRAEENTDGVDEIVNAYLALSRTQRDRAMRKMRKRQKQMLIKA